MLENISTYYLTQGVLGVTVVALIAVVIWQQKRIDAKDKQITDLQDKRVADTNSYTNSYTQTTREMVGVTKDSLNAMLLLQKSVDTVAQLLNNLISNGHKQ